MTSRQTVDESQSLEGLESVSPVLWMLSYFIFIFHLGKELRGVECHLITVCLSKSVVW